MGLDWSDERSACAAIGLRFADFPDVGPAPGEVDILFDVILPTFGHVLIGEDCPRRTDGGAQSTIDTGVRIDDQHFRRLVKTLDRANTHTVAALTADAGFTDNARHQDSTGRGDAMNGHFHDESVARPEY